MKRLLGGLVLLILVGGAGWYWYNSVSRAGSVVYRTDTVSRGDLLATVAATGTLEPEDVVDVGSQVAGMIKELGVAPDGSSIDYDSAVEAGTVLAKIDDSLYRARVDQTRAQLRSAQQKVEQAKAKADSQRAKVDQARANTQRADADLLAAKAKVTQASRDVDRARRLMATSALAQSDLDAYQAAFDTNKAGIGVAEASIAQSKAAEADAKATLVEATAAIGDSEAAVELARAALKQDEVNLGYCTITSPVKGTIIDRRVTIGQTVQSSFNTPSLFLIAKDLKRMRVWASVNEADIGHIHVGQAVKFTVDAHPSEKFRGTVGRIRLNAANTQNVVTYTVEVVTDNSSGRLLPYMTANLRFEVDQRQSALLVSNAALRYRSAKGSGTPRGGSEASSERSDNAAVWVMENGAMRRVTLRVGLTDGNKTEVLEGELPEGTAVVTGESRAAAGDDSTNPFAPKMFGGKKQ